MNTSAHTGSTMNTSAHTGREYWRAVLVAGGATSPARWTRDPVPGTSVVEAAVPEALVTGLDRLTASMGVRPTSPMLAAHAKVLAALTGETAVTTGYAAGMASGPLPCRLTTGGASWRELVLHADRTESELLAHKDFPVDALRSELGLPATTPAVVFDPAGVSEPVRDAVLQVAVLRRSGGCVLRLRYATEVLDEASATRIAGYHLTALRLIAAGPDAAHGRQSLLSPEELRHQTDGLAYPRRELPDLRFHELFAQQARAHPDAVAAVHGDRQCTYRDLDRRANRLAHALLDSGLGRQDVVAVVTERNLDWLAAFLAVLKAGGVYLPVEPHFPADRIATMLTRVEAAHVCSPNPAAPPRSTAPWTPCRGYGRRSSAHSARRTTRSPTPACRSARRISRTSSSPPAPPARPRARWWSTRACSTTSSRRSTTCGSVRTMSSPRPHPSASTFPCGSSSRPC